MIKINKNKEIIKKLGAIIAAVAFFFIAAHDCRAEISTSTTLYYWQGDNTADDFFGRAGKDLVWESGTGYLTGIINEAFEIDVSSPHYLKTEFSDSIIPDNHEWSMSMWFFYDETSIPTTTAKSIFYKGNEGILQYRDGGKLNWQYKNINGDWAEWTSDLVYDLRGIFRNLIIVANDTNYLISFKMFSNGVEISGSWTNETRATYKATKDATTALLIGWRTGGSQYDIGNARLDDFVFTNYIFSNWQIASLSGGNAYENIDEAEPINLSQDLIISEENCCEEESCLLPVDYSAAMDGYKIQTTLLTETIPCYPAMAWDFELTLDYYGQRLKLPFAGLNVAGKKYACINIIDTSDRVVETREIELTFFASTSDFCYGLSESATTTPEAWCENLCDDIPTSTSFFDMSYNLQCGARSVFCWLFTPKQDVKALLANSTAKISSVFPYNLRTQLVESFSATSTIRLEEIKLPKPAKYTDFNDEMTVLTTSSFPALIGTTSWSIINGGISTLLAAFACVYILIRLL